MMISQFEMRFWDRVKMLTDDQVHDFAGLGALSGPVASDVLRFMLESACCKGQSMNTIQSGRKGVLALPRVWVNAEIMDVARECLDPLDEWEEMRFAELCELLTVGSL